MYARNHSRSPGQESLRGSSPTHIVDLETSVGQMFSVIKKLPRRGVRWGVIGCLATCMRLGSHDLVLAQGEEWAVEDMVCESDLVVLGKVIKRDEEGIVPQPGGMVYTRFWLAVEEYYKGTGPEKVAILLEGGLYTGPDGRKYYLSIANIGGPGGTGTREGEELVAFLKAHGPGFMFHNQVGSKLVVGNYSGTEDREVGLRLRKKKYMRGKGLERFKELEKEVGDHEPTARAEATLQSRRGRYGYIGEVVPVRELRTRMREIISGECGAGR